jgi:type II secretory pathway predicted ATPase ExeA
VFARPTADQIWLGPPQEAALSRLSGPAPLRLLVGPLSSGKTTLAQYVATQAGADTVVLRCRGSKNDPAAVLTSFLLSADLGPWDLSEIELRNLLTVFVQQRRSQGRRVLAIVDDAETLKVAAKEEMQRLAAFKIDQRPALEMLVAGPPSLVQDWPATDQVVIVCELRPPSIDDVVGYLAWRLERFDLRNVITPVAAQMIARLSGGRYAAADVLCQMALLVLRQLSLERVDARVVRQAVATLVARQGAKLEPDGGIDHTRVDLRPPGHLLISRGGKVMAKATLGERTLVGRSEHNDVCLPSPYLSRHHAVIVGTPEGYYLVDLHSANGVALNGRRVERAVLCDQDVLTLGPYRVKIQIPEELAPASPLPNADSLAETAVMPQQSEENAVRRVK